MLPKMLLFPFWLLLLEFQGFPLLFPLFLLLLLFLFLQSPMMKKTMNLTSFLCPFQKFLLLQHHYQHRWKQPVNPG